MDTTLTATQINQDSDGMEQLWLRIMLSRGDNLAFGCAYRSPNSTDDNDELGLLHKTLRGTVAMGHSHLLVCGDHNYPDIDWESWTMRGENSVSSNFIEALRDCYLYQHVTEATRVRGQDQHP